MAVDPRRSSAILNGRHYDQPKKEWMRQLGQTALNSAPIFGGAMLAMRPGTQFPTFERRSGRIWDLPSAPRRMPPEAPTYSAHRCPH